MISGSFHPVAQEWRYFSREKSLIHTLHLAQLPSGTPGDTVLIAQTPSLLNNHLGLGGFSVPPINLPGAPSINNTVFNTFLQSVSSACYGCVSDQKVITAQRNCGISIDSWTSTLLQVTFSPVYSGRYLLHVHGQSDRRTSSYQGPNADGQLVLDGYADGNLVLAATAQLFQSNMIASQEIQGVIHSSGSGIASVTSSVVFKGVGNGNPLATPGANMGCFIMLIDPVPA